MTEPDTREEGRVHAIWVKRAHRGKMDAVPEARLVEGKGVAGSADSGGRRQVTIIDLSAWRRACAEIGVEADPAARRANLMLDGVELAGSRGRTLQIGDTHVRILGETRPCERMDEAAPGLRAALKSEWRGGAFGEILRGGMVRVGDPARWADPVG